ncbi:MAG TPA: AMP-binding protein [Acidimicrobiales bacterium]|nr:AMP-binding protein [Acidimicrobiales bacterium]
MTTLVALLDAARPADPSTALLDLPSGESLTYGEIDDWSARLGAVLRDAGAAKGDRVLVQMEKSALAVALYLACVRSGMVLVPANPAYTDDELAFLIGDAEPMVVVVDPRRIDGVRAPAVLTADDTGCGSLADAAAAARPQGSDAPVGDDDLAAVLYTSGTTGRPKGAMLTQAHLANNASALIDGWGFGPDDVLLHALPLFHAHGLFVALNCALGSGSRLIMLARFDPDAVLDQLSRATVFMGVPTYYTRLLAHPRLDRHTCRRVRLFVSGSAPLAATTHAAFEERTGQRILERYGMTETLMITSNPLDGERRAGSVGRPLRGVTVAVVDRQRGTPLPPGEVGEIAVGTDPPFAGYWRRPGQAEVGADGLFMTGDLGRWDDDGYLSIVGRARDLVISGGLNVYPGEVEAVLDDLEGVRESAVVGLPDPDLGEKVVAVVVADPGCDLDPERLRADARRRLAPYKVPKAITVVDALPRNVMGKVEKALLRQRLAGG